MAVIHIKFEISVHGAQKFLQGAWGGLAPPPPPTPIDDGSATVKFVRFM